MRYGAEWELLDGDLSELGDGEGRPSDLALARVVVGGVVSASVRPSVRSFALWPNKRRSQETQDSGGGRSNSVSVGRFFLRAK